MPADEITPPASRPLGTPAPLVRREDLTAVLDELHLVKESVDTAVNTAVDAKNRRWKILFIIVGVVMVLLVGAIVALGVIAVKAQDDRERLSAVVLAQKSDTDQRRIDACERDNVARTGFRLIAFTTATGFNQFAALLIGDSEIDAELQAQIDAFNTNVSGPLAVLANEKSGPFADRDCSRGALGITP